MATGSRRCTASNASLARHAPVGLEIAEAAGAVGHAADRIEHGGDVAAAQAGLAGPGLEGAAEIEVGAAAGRVVDPQTRAGLAFEDDRLAGALVAAELEHLDAIDRRTVRLVAGERGGQR